MFRYCPDCSSQNIQFKEGKKSFCPDCGFTFYHNTAAAAGCVISTGTEIALLIRAKDPAKGKLDLPGGFINPGEGAIEGLRRECLEEISWDPGPDLVLFASFPNIYPYKNITYNTCDLFFTITAPGLKPGDFKLEEHEIGGVLFVNPFEIKQEDLAFDSTRRAINAFLNFRK
ncbi:MutT/NUDIX family protein [Treponema primitia ZAS-2]|uniref:MutT/NUDIX family protein n=1 Tax=Treponema primitia (strain ATCC BAA-887 / DSM 12427 / ZAS-2) TaxID=545694 RepID=F5YME1_TREPZ|nr:NUDIX domain-containing protein [Treponema primitia]AEF84062.1 MutT/NUDIX family protein [Treponema primitia ZAS-2]